MKVPDDVQALQLLTELVAYEGLQSVKELNDRLERARRFLKRVAPDMLEKAVATAKREAWGDE